MSPVLSLGPSLSHKSSCDVMNWYKVAKVLSCHDTLSFLCRYGFCCVRISSHIWTDHTRPIQFDVRELYCGKMVQKEVTETKGEKREKRGHRSRGSTFYLGYDVTAHT